MSEQSDEDWFIINDLDEFVNKTRTLVFNSFGKENDQDISDISLDISSESELEEMNIILSHNESLIIAKNILRCQTNKKNKSKRYLVSTGLYHKYITSLNERMIGNILNRLVNKGLVESAFDNDSNDFVFWIKDENEDNNKPETD